MVSCKYMEKNEGPTTISVSVRSMFYALLIAVFAVALYYLRDIVFVFLTSIVIASFVESGVKRLRKRGMGRSLAVVIIYFLALAICITLGYLFIPIFLEQLTQLSGVIAKYLPNTAPTLHIPTAGESFGTIFNDLESLTTSAGSGAIEASIALFGGIFNFVLLIVLSFYLSIHEGGIETFIRIVSPAKHADYAVDLWKRTDRKIGLWFQGQLLLGLLVGVLTYLGLLIFDIKYSLLLALLVAVMELIPFGIMLAVIPAIASGYLSHGSTGALEVAGLYLIIHQFEINLISPLIVKKVVGISPLVVILSVLVGMKLAGFWGVMLSIPFAVCLMEFLDDIKKKKGILA